MNDACGHGAKKIDRRVLKTRKALFEAFDRLVCVKDYDKITISELAREADIDRKTFYLHYASIDEMLDDKVNLIVGEILDEVEEDMRRRCEAASDASVEGAVTPAVEPDLRVFFDGVNRVMRAYLPMKEHIFSAMPAGMLADRLGGPLAKEIKRRGLARLNVEEDVLEICISSLVGGFLGAYIAWLDHGMQVSDERVSDIASRMLGACLREFS